MQAREALNEAPRVPEMYEKKKRERKRVSGLERAKNLILISEQIVYFFLAFLCAE